MDVSGQPSGSYPAMKGVTPMDGQDFKLTQKEMKLLHTALKAGIYKELKTKGLLTDSQLAQLLERNSGHSASG